MAQEYSTQVVPFINRGLVQKVDVSLLQEGQYQQLSNMISLAEGTLTTKNGHHKINATEFPYSSDGSAISLIHTISRLATGSDPDTNYRYIGANQFIYRANSNDNPTLTEIADIEFDQFGKRWTAQPYRKSSSGFPYMYFATGSLMLKDPLSDNVNDNGTDLPVSDPPTLGNLRKWGIDAPANPVFVVDDTVPGDLSSTISPYNYVYTRRNPKTGHEGPPSIPMTLENEVSGVNIQITIRVDALNVAPQDFYNYWGYRDPQVIGEKSIAIYRKGGTFSDGYYRLVTYLDTDVATETIDFVDNVPDIKLSSITVDFDNDPPVTASMPIPLVAEISSYTDGTGAADAVSMMHLTILQGFQPGQDELIDILRPGSEVTVGEGDTQERCVVINIGTPDLITMYFQYAHLVGERVTCGSVRNAPCKLSCQAFNSIFLAGDANNPSTIYKSKTGRPEAFPVVNLADGSPGSIECGSPSNPVMALAEFNGEVISLNKSNIFLVRVWNGAMQSPIVTPAQRGLFAPNAWCKADNEIWYLAYDGIYSWAGGDSTKRSEAIDPIFKGEWVNGIPPISLNPVAAGGSNLSDLELVVFAYHKNQIFITYLDLSGNKRRLRYHQLYDRWSIDTTVAATEMYLEQDTGTFLFASSEDIGGGNFRAFINQDDTVVTPVIPATTEGWIAGTQDDGDPIVWEVFTPFYGLGSPTLQKQWGDVALELQNPADTITVETYYDFSSTADATDTFTITPLAGRRRFFMPLKSGSAQEARSVAFRFTGSTTQPTTLYTLTFTYLPLQYHQRGRADDWDNLGYEHDKRLQQVSMEYDVEGSTVTLNLDTMSGIGGNTYTAAVQTFTLDSPAATVASGPVRARTTFPINDGIVAKLVRLRPTVVDTLFKRFPYKFDFLPYPPDKVLFTEWSDEGYPCEKILRELILEIDTGDVEATINVEVDGEIKQTEAVTTTIDDRHRILTMDPDIIGKLFRLTLVPGTGGKTQLFKHKFNWIAEPCAVTFWSSYELAFNYNGYKFIKQLFVEYRCNVGVTMKVYTDNKTLFFEKELPRHERRDVERFYLPAINATVLNKSKVYLFELISCDECQPFYLYHDSTRAEWMPWNAGQRQAYQQAQLFEPMDRGLMP